MKKVLNRLLVLCILFFISISFIPVTVAAEENKNNIVFDLSNPMAQSITVIENNQKVTYYMSEELLMKDNREIVPLGSFSRDFKRTDDNITMQARFTGSVNPYFSSITNVSNGIFNARYGHFIRERYYANQKYGDYGSGKYSVDYSSQYGTYTISLVAYVIPGQTGGNVKLFFSEGI